MIRIPKVYTILLLALLFAASCRQAFKPQMRNEKKEIAEFDKIHASGNVELIYTQNGFYSVEMDQKEKDPNKTVLFVKDSTLVIRIDEMTVPHGKHKKVIIRISSPKIREICVSKAADFTSAHLSADSLFLHSNNGSDIAIGELAIKKHCKMIFSKGVDCKIGKLSAQNLTLSCSEACDISLRQLSTQNIQLTASGGTDIVLQGKTEWITLHSGSGSDICLRELRYTNLTDNGPRRSVK